MVKRDILMVKKRYFDGQKRYYYIYSQATKNDATIMVSFFSGAWIK